MRGSIAPLLVVVALGLFLAGIACEGNVLGPLGGISLKDVDRTFRFWYTDLDAVMLRPVEPPPPERQVGSLLYQASVIPIDTSLQSDPMSLEVVVAVRNPTLDTMTLQAGQCAVGAEAYDSPQRTGPPIWARQFECGGSYSRIGPLDTAQFSFLAYDVMLADALPDGRYYWNARFRQQYGDSLILRAGSGDVRLRVPGIRYRVRVREEDRKDVHVEVSLTNLNEETTRITFGDCALSLALYRDVNRLQRVQRWPAQDVCLRYLAVRDIGAGASVQPDEFVRTFEASRLADAGLSPGLYYLTAVLAHNWRTYEFLVGPMQIW